MTAFSTASYSRAGRVSWGVIRVYITAMGGLLRFGVLMTWFVLVELCRVGATVWLSYWTGVTESGAGHMELREATCHATILPFSQALLALQSAQGRGS